MNREFSNSSIQISTKGEATLVWFESTAKGSVVCDEVDRLSSDLTGLTSVGDGASDSDVVVDSGTESEHNTEVVVSISSNGGSSTAVNKVFSSGEDLELPAPFTKLDSLISGGEAQ